MTSATVFHDRLIRVRLKPRVSEELSQSADLLPFRKSRLIGSKRPFQYQIKATLSRLSQHLIHPFANPLPFQLSFFNLSERKMTHHATLTGTSGTGRGA